MSLKSPIEVTIPWIPGYGHAITLWPFVFYEPGIQDDECVREHELYHWKEQRQWWVIPWFIAYIVLVLLHWGQPADRHPLEVEAYAVERDCRRKAKQQEVASQMFKPEEGQISGFAVLQVIEVGEQEATKQKERLNDSQ